MTPENTPTDYHFNDVDQVYVRSGWSGDAWRARLWAGSVFGNNAVIAKRYNWAHCQVNQGSFVLSKGLDDIILEPSAARTFRKSAANANTMIINDTDQWGEGQVWHPKLDPFQISKITFFADGQLISAARADLTPAYPPEARAKFVTRCLVHLKPNSFLLFDRIQLQGEGKVEWRFHAAFVNPMTPASEYTAFAYQRIRGTHDRTGTKYTDYFAKKQDVSCHIAFLYPKVKANVGMSDLYFRWSPFYHPQRHLKVVQQGKAGMNLLTLFSPRPLLRPQGSAFVGSSEGVNWTVVLGRGSYKELRCSGFITVLAEKPASHAAEIFSFGTNVMSWKGLTLESTEPDFFAAIKDGKVVKRLESF